MSYPCMGPHAPVESEIVWELWNPVHSHGLLRKPTPKVRSVCRPCLRSTSSLRAIFCSGCPLDEGPEKSTELHHIELSVGIQSNEGPREAVTGRPSPSALRTRSRARHWQQWLSMMPAVVATARPRSRQANLQFAAGVHSRRQYPQCVVQAIWQSRQHGERSRAVSDST